MTRIQNALMTLSLFSLSSAALAAPTYVDPKKDQPGRKAWMRCIYFAPSAASGTAASVATPAYSPTSGTLSGNYGFVFGLEVNNGNMLSVDTFQLNDKGMKVKQVGHAEAQSQVSAVSGTDAGSSSVAVSGNLTVANSIDSPMVFSLVSAAASPSSKFSATISAVLFNGNTLTNLAANCKMAKQEIVSKKNSQLEGTDISD